jgi:hypothetical protein
MKKQKPDCKRAQTMRLFRFHVRWPARPFFSSSKQILPKKFRRTPGDTAGCKTQSSLSRHHDTPQVFISINVLQVYDFRVPLDGAMLGSMMAMGSTCPMSNTTSSVNKSPSLASCIVDTGLNTAPTPCLTSAKCAS